MKHIIFFMFILLTLFVYGQKGKTVPFKAVIIDKKDTIKTGFSFFIIAQNDTVHPKLADNFFKIKIRDSIVDFYLMYRDRLFVFRGVETFRLISNSYWEIHLNDKASDSSYSIIARQAGCFSNVGVGGRNTYAAGNIDGKQAIIPLPTNTVYISYYTPKDRRKNNNR